MACHPPANIQPRSDPNSWPSSRSRARSRRVLRRLGSAGINARREPSHASGLRWNAVGHGVLRIQRRPPARRGPGATDANAVAPVRAKFEVAPRRRGRHPAVIVARGVAQSAMAASGPDRKMTRPISPSASDARSDQLEDGVGAVSGPPSNSPQWPRRITSRSTHPTGIGTNHWAMRNSITAAVSCSVNPDPATLDRIPM